MAKDTSPFSQTDFHPIGDIYTREGILFGLKTPSGDIVINFDHNTRYAKLLQIARLTNCEVVQVRGTWTFLPSKTKVIMDEGDEYDSQNGKER